VGEILGELENLWIERNFNLDRENLVARLEARVQPD
jgi:poly(A) polymerase